MRTIRLTIILALFITILSSTTTWGQKFKSIDEIYATTDTISGTYIPIDLQDALRVLDTLFSKGMQDTIKKGQYFPFFWDQYLQNKWWMGANSRIMVFLKDKYNIQFTESAAGLILDAYEMRLQNNKDEDIEEYVNKRYYKKPRTAGPLTKAEKEYVNYKKKYRKEDVKEFGLYVGRKVYFTYVFGCETERECAYARENYKEGKSLMHKVMHAPYGVITKVDLKKYLFQVKLLKAIENDRVIVFDKYKRKPYIHSYRQYEPYYNGGTAGKYFMNVGDKMWFSMCISIWDPYYWFTKNMLKEYYDD